MSTPVDVLPLDNVGAIARCRHFVLKRANELLRDQSGIPVVERADTLPGVSGLLMTSLEALKVAEEELRVQNTLIESQRAATDNRVRHYRQLFLYAPSPTFITDIYGTIQEANLEAARFFGARRDFSSASHSSPFSAPNTAKSSGDRFPDCQSTSPSATGGS